MIKAISLDLWGTVLFGNPTFKINRAQFLGTLTGVDTDLVEPAFKTVDELWTSYEETYPQFAIQPNVRFATVFDLLSIDKRKYSYIHLQAIIEQLFRDEPPIIHADALAFFEECELPIVIATNTGFMSGAVLKQILKNKDIEYHNMVASDEIGMCKPNGGFFNEVLNSSPAHGRNQIIHVGDNTQTDIMGANAFGFQTYLIDHNTLNFKQLLDVIKVQP